MLEHFVCHFLKSAPVKARAISHSIYRAATETKEWGGHIRFESLHRRVQRTNRKSEALKWRMDSLLKLLIIFDPVTDDADHFAQLGHHLLLLRGLYFHSQRSERRHVFWRHILQFLLYDPAGEQRPLPKLTPAHQSYPVARRKTAALEGTYCHYCVWVCVCICRQKKNWIQLGTTWCIISLHIIKFFSTLYCCPQ